MIRSHREVQENSLMRIYEQLENKEGEHSGDDYFFICVIWIVIRLKG